MIDIEKKAIEYQNQFKVYNKACNYLINRGFRNDSGLGTMVKTSQIGTSLTKGDYYYGYLIFPVIDLKGKIVSFTGRRILDSVTPIHKHWYGTIDYFYNHYTLSNTLSKNRTIYITESPLDCLSLCYAGFSSVATMGSSRLPTNYTDLQEKDVIILFDTDLNKTGQSKAKLLASKIHSICRLVEIAHIPLPKGYKKIDVNDLLKSTDICFGQAIWNLTHEATTYIYEEPVKTNYVSECNLSGYDIMDIVSEHVNLSQIGGLYRAYCPFHNDSDPSFTVYPQTNSYFCFGCDKGGDIISFLQELMGFEFIEAKKYLEVNYG